jgi:hypothetical protein
MFLVAYWISFNYRGLQRNSLLTRVNNVALNGKFSFFTLICLIQFISVFVPIYFDYRYPFSASQEVAKYLVKNNLQNCVLFGDKDFCTEPVAGWIDRKIYYPAIGDYARNTIWNHPNRKNVPLTDIQNNTDYFQTIKQEARELADKTSKDVIMILNYQMDENPLRKFTTSIVADEIYYLYRVGSPQ